MEVGKQLLVNPIIFIFYMYLPVRINHEKAASRIHNLGADQMSACGSNENMKQTPQGDLCIEPAKGLWYEYAVERGKQF